MPPGSGGKALKMTLTPRVGGRFAELLPWYINGTLTPALRAEMAALIDSSPVCRREFEKLNAVADAMLTEVCVFDEGASAARLAARVRAREGVRPAFRMNAFTLRRLVPRLALAIATVAMIFQIAMLFVD